MNKIPKTCFATPISLNLGCGQKEGDHIGIDKRDVGQTIVWDLTNGIPFADNSVDEIISSHFLEHLNNKEVEDLFKEIYRVLKDGGLLKVNIPHASEPEAFYLNHNSFWNEERVDAICNDPQQGAGQWNFKIRANQKKAKQLFFILKKYEPSNS